jgi:glycosyltransferase involved in cell wall biosynthesis
MRLDIKDNDRWKRDSLSMRLGGGPHLRCSRGGCLMALRVLNVNDTLDLETGGGTAERTFQMSRHLARQGAQCDVLTIASVQLEAQRIEAAMPATVVALPCFWRRFHVPWRGWKTIRRMVHDADVIHLMGHWSVLNALVYFAARQINKPYVICPAGALPLFGRSKWLKRIYNLLVGNAIVSNASGWIAVTKSELPQFEDYGVHPSRVTVISNGVSEEDFPLLDTNEFKRRHGLPDAPMILFMGRLNPIKGPDILLDAFILTREAFSNAHLIFAGPDGGMLSRLKLTAENKGVGEFVHFLGFVEGGDKVSAYRAATLLVVPSRQEAMSIVAIEAGFCGTPVLLTDQCGFSEIRLIDAGLEVPATVAGIAAGLSNWLKNSDKTEEISLAWSNFVRRKYSWTSLVPEYIRLYKNIIESSQR